MFYKICANCGNRMCRQKKSEASRMNWQYCSPACATIKRNKDRALPRIKCACLECASVFEKTVTSKRRFCSASCSIKKRNREQNPSKTPERRKKISEQAKLRSTDHLRTPEARKKLSVALRGSGHWNWQGGITPQNKILRVRVEYKTWRKAVFERDNYTCVLCHVRGGYLEADHIKPFAFFPELRNDINNGRTLCRECHKKTPTYMGKVHGYMKKYNLQFGG